jgi:hypothetical protein
MLSARKELLTGKLTKQPSSGLLRAEGIKLVGITCREFVTGM